MRIVAGRFGGRRLTAPSWRGLRPTSDGLRETLFNVIAPRVAGARVLDAFAGTGALGLEALSRGAASVTFVDRDRRAVALITDNARRCGALEACVIIRADAGRAGRLEAGRFDLVLADPPYESAGLEAVLATLGACLAAGGLLVLEHAKRRDVPGRVGALARVRQIVSGDSALAFYELVTPRGPGAGDPLGTPHER